MSKIAVVYWSGTGNTQAMAESVLYGARNAGAEADIFAAADFSAELMDKYDAIAFGCPSMGSEELEDSEFQPVFSECEPLINGKRIALFGSYGWGDGVWMRNWEETCKGDGAILVSDPVICCDSPDDEALTACQALGAALI
jgi:flavodoxin short chain